MYKTNGSVVPEYVLCNDSSNIFILRLEYKYHKLIQNASDRSGELPGAPQCVGDEEDDEEEVGYVG